MASIVPPAPSIRQGRPAVSRRSVAIGRVRAPVRRLKNIGKALAHDERCRLVHMHVDPATLDMVRAASDRRSHACGRRADGSSARRRAASPRPRSAARAGRARRRPARSSRRRRRRVRREPSSGDGGSSGWTGRRRPTLARPAARRPRSRSPGWSGEDSGASPPADRSFAKRRSVLARVAAASASGVKPFASATTLAVAAT